MEKDEIVLLTKKQAAEMFAVSEATINRWRAEGLIPHVKIGTGNGRNQTIRFRRDQLLKIIEENTVPTKDEIQLRLSF